MIPTLTEEEKTWWTRQMRRYSLRARNKITFKSGWSTERSGTQRVNRAKAKQEPLRRPEAAYSNAGFLEVTKKYAS